MYFQGDKYVKIDFCFCAERLEVNLTSCLLLMKRLEGYLVIWAIATCIIDKGPGPSCSKHP